MPTILDTIANRRLPYAYGAMRIGRQTPEQYNLSPEEEQSLVRSLGQASLSGLARTANLLDTQGGAVRLAMVGRNPLTSFAHPLSGEGRVSGRDVLETYGLAPKNIPGFHPIKHPVDALFDVGGLATEIATDPLTYETFFASAVGKVGKAIKAAGLSDELTRVATHALPGRSMAKAVGPRTARMTVTPRQIIDDAVGRGVTDARDRILRTGISAADLSKEMDKPIGGLVRFKMPGVPEVVVRGGKAGEKIAGALDATGAAIGGTAPARYLSRVFNARVADAKTAWGQTWMKMHFARKLAGAASGREKYADIARGIEEEAAKLGNLDLIKDPDTFRRIVEGIDKSMAGSKTLDEAWNKLLPGELADLQRSGINIRQLQDVYAKYWPRYQTRGLHTAGTGSARNMTASAEHQSKAHRMDFLMHMPGGTEVFNRLTKDPNIAAMVKSGTASVDDVEKYLKSLPAFASQAAREYPRFGPRGMMMEVDPVTGMKRPVFGDRVKVLAGYLSELAQETRDAGLFSNHALDDLRHYLTRSGEAQKSADTLGDMIADLGRQPGVLKTLLEHKYQPGQGLKQGMYVRDLNRGNIGRIVGINNGIADVFFRNRQTGQMTPQPVAIPLTQLQSTKMFRPAGTKRLPTIGKVLTKAGLVHGDTAQGALLNIANKMGITPTDTALRELAQTSIPEEYFDDITNVMTTMRAPSPLSELGEKIAPAMNIWKSFQTNWPAFHGRNFPSGTAQNAMAGMLGFGDIGAANVVARGGVIQGAAKAKSVPSAIAAQGDAAATEWARRQAFAHEVVSPRQQEIQPLSKNPLDWLKPENEAPFTYDELQRQFPGARPEPLKNIAKGLIPLHQSGNVALGEAVEGLNRFSPFWNQLRKGVDPSEAARRVTEAQVGYQGRYYTPTERFLASSAIPFYKFGRSMASYVPSQLAQKPGGPMAQTIRAINYGRDADATTPDYVSETASIPLGPGPSGQDRYLTGMGFMFEDPLQFVDDPKTQAMELLSRTSPLLKTPLEYATGQTFFQRDPRGGRPLEDLDPTYGRILSNITDKFTGKETARAKPFLGQTGELLAGNLIGRPGTSVRMLTDPRKELWNKAMQFTTGMRIADVSPASQDAIVREQLGAAMKGEGAREFTKTFFPPELVEGLPPAERLAILRMKALNDLLAQRAKERKKAKKRTR